MCFYSNSYGEKLQSMDEKYGYLIGLNIIQAKIIFTMRNPKWKIIFVKRDELLFDISNKNFIIARLNDNNIIVSIENL